MFHNSPSFVVEKRDEAEVESMIEHKININTHFYKVSLLLTQSLNQNSLAEACANSFPLDGLQALMKLIERWMDGKCLNSFSAEKYLD